MKSLRGKQILQDGMEIWTIIRNMEMLANWWYSKSVTDQGHPI